MSLIEHTANRAGTLCTMNNGFDGWCDEKSTCVPFSVCPEQKLNCNHDLSDGCEIDFNESNCGGCGIVCSGDTPHCVGEGFPNTVYHCGNL